MSAIIDSELTSRFRSRADEPSAREAVLVTCDPPVAREALESAGMDVRFVSGDGRISAGLVDRAGLDRLADLPGVQAIEADTEMHALDGG